MPSPFPDSESVFRRALRRLCDDSNATKYSAADAAKLRGIHAHFKGF
jgi:hypothetical protein